MKARQTGPDAIERQMKLSGILNQRIGGKSLREIGQAQNPPCSPQAIFKTIKKGLAGVVTETVAEIRLLEAQRLDALQNAIWPQAVAGDVQAINTVLSIMQRRARLLGLNVQRSAYVGPDGVEIDIANPAAIRVTIENNPEVERVKWLESERERLLGISVAEGDKPTIN